MATAVMEESAAQLDDALTFETHEDPQLKSVGYVATEDEDERTVHYEDQEEMDGIAIVDGLALVAGYVDSLDVYRGHLC